MLQILSANATVVKYVFAVALIVMAALLHFGRKRMLRDGSLLKTIAKTGQRFGIWMAMFKNLKSRKSRRIDDSKEFGDTPTQAGDGATQAGDEATQAGDGLARAGDGSAQFGQDAGSAQSGQNRHAPRPSVRLAPFARMDALIIAAFCLTGGIMAFRDLGSFEAPATEYAIEAGESLVFDFGEDQNITTMNWYLKDIDSITFTLESRNS